MKTLRLITFLVALLVVNTNEFYPQKLTGFQIMEKVYDRPEGNDMTSDLTMNLKNDSGDEGVRKIKRFTRDFGTMEKKIMFFVSPADVKNTSFMNWSYSRQGQDDDQWIYLPALKKTKRISSESKSDYFMGSDFTYDDLGDRQPNEDSHKLLKEEKYNSDDCYVIESKPEQLDYMYSRTVSWVAKDKWIVLKKEFYDEDGDLLKTLTVKKFENISGILVVTHTEMKNVQKNHQTIMDLKNVNINSGIEDSKFTERIMTRGL